MDGACRDRLRLFDAFPRPVKCQQNDGFGQGAKNEGKYSLCSLLQFMRDEKWPRLPSYYYYQPTIMYYAYDVPATQSCNTDKQDRLSYDTLCIRFLVFSSKQKLWADSQLQGGARGTVVCSRSGRSPMKTRSTGSFLWFILDQQEPELQCSVLVEHFFPHSSSFQRRSLKPFLKVNHNSRSNISSLGQPSPPRRFC
jgi:hypothetical protein